MAGPGDSQALLLTLSADTSKALKALDALNDKLAGVQPKARAAAKSIDDAFAQSRLGKASFAVGEEIGGKLRELTGAAPAAGSALVALGGAGIAAAAGFGALALALPKVREALDYVDELGDTAVKLHVTTTALQEYRFAVVEAGGTSKDFDESVEGLTSTLGKYQAGLAKGRTLKALAALGIDEGLIASAHDISDLLPQIADKIAAVQSVSEREALADAIGVKPLLPLLEQGSAALETMRGKAQDLGVVIGGEVVRTMGDLQRQVEIAAQRVDVNMKEAFLGLAPILVQIAGLAADVARAISRIPDAARGLQLGSGAVKRPSGTSFGQVFSLVADGFTGGAYSAAGRSFNALAARGQARSLMLGNAPDKETVGRLLREEDEREGQTLASTLTTPGKEKAAKGAKGPSTDALARQAEERRKSTADTLADAAKRVEDAYGSELRSILGVTTDIQTRADLESRQVDAATEAAEAADRKKLTDVRSQEALGKIAKGTADEVAAQQSVAAAVRAKAAELDKEAIDRRRDQELQQQEQRDRERINSAYDAILQISIGQARTAGERQALELRLLASEKRQADQALTNERKAELVGKDAAQATGVNSRFDALQAASDDQFKARGSEILQNSLGPLQEWAKQAPRTAQEVGEAFERYAVKSLDDLNSGLADAIAKGGDIGDVLKSAFADAEAALVRYLLKQAEIGLIGGGSGPLGFLSSILLPKHALGTDSAPGGLSLVGERGPELVNLQRGSQVIPNATLAALARMQPPSAAAPIYAPSFDLRGAVVTQDLLDQMNVIGSQHGQAARAGAVADARRIIPTDLSASARRRLPGG